MSIRIIRKALTLLVVDIVIIIGIFVLQFRADSSIIEKIGNLQFTFNQIEDMNKNLITQNKLRMAYNGLNFYADDQNPAVIRTSESEIVPVQFIGWSKKDDLTCVLNFTQDVSVTFELASPEPTASLAIVASLPRNVTDFSIPYTFSSNMKVQKDETNRIIVNSRKAAWEASAFSIESGYFDLNKKDYIATYSVYDENQKFTFDSIIDLPIADALYYQQNIQNFKNNLIAAFKANSSEANLSEQVVVSYIAAQAEKDNYQQAVEDIPVNLKKSKQRTYLSAPYLNTLEEMNVILQKTISDYEKKITESSVSGSLDIFTVHNIANFMCIHSKPEVVKTLLQNAAGANISNASLAQATGLLQVFDDLSKLDSSYAEYLLPVMDSCIERISSSCAFEGNILTISENDTFLSVIQAVETGIAVMRYGLIMDNPTLIKAGYVIVNSYLTENSSYDLRTLSNLYPIIAYDNWYYPHFQKIDTKDSDFIWAWTCAKSITCQKDADNSITLTVDFPENLSHYIILKGIPQFTSIYIYNMAFRTDPRFESYNSSGYVYKQASETLLLKSRHKQQFETVRLEYTDKPLSSKPAESAEENKVENDTVIETSETRIENVEPSVNETSEDNKEIVTGELETNAAEVQPAVIETAPSEDTAVLETVTTVEEEPVTNKKKSRKNRKNSD